MSLTTCRNPRALAFFAAGYWLAIALVSAGQARWVEVVIAALNMSAFVFLGIPSLSAEPRETADEGGEAVRVNP